MQAGARRHGCIVVRIVIPVVASDDAIVPTPF